MWARWIKKTDRSTYVLGLPSMSVEQLAGIGRAQGQKPLPAWSVEMRIDRAVESLHPDNRRIVFCAHKIPVTVRECVEMEIAICGMSRYKDSQDCYTWPSNMADARALIGIGREEFKNLYNYVLGKIDEKLEKAA